MRHRLLLAAPFAVALLVGAAAAQSPQCLAFYDQPSFDSYCSSNGKFIKGVENFEEGYIAPGGKNCFPAPLGPLPNFPNFPNGLLVKNLIIQDNVTPGPSPAQLNPSGNGCALYVVGAGFIGSNSIKIGEDLFLQGINASIDLILTEPVHTGVGFQLSRFSGFPTGGWIVTVYNFANLPVAVYNVPPPTASEPTKDFFGVWCDGGIGRINIFDMAGPAPDGLDDIELWQDFSTAAHTGSWGHLKMLYR
jgi:hypothetical protein